MSTIGSTPAKKIPWNYMRRLFGYCLAEKKLLGLVVVTGTLGFSISFAFPYLIGSLMDNVIAPHGTNGVMPTHSQRMAELTLLTIYGIAAAVVIAFAGWGRGHYTMQLGNRIVCSLRRDLFDHLQKLSMHFYSRQRSGGLVWRIMHEVHGVNGLIHAGVILVILDVLNLIIAFVLLMSISWKLALAVCAVMPLYVLTFRVFNPAIRKTSEQTAEHYGRIIANLSEKMAGISLIKSYAAEEREAAKFQADNEEQYTYVVAQSRVGHAVGAVSEMWMSIGTSIIIGFGGLMALNSELSAGDIMRVIGYAGIFYGPLKRFAELDMVYQNSMTSVRRVFRIFDIQPKVAEMEGARTLPPAHGEIEYRDVRFHYEDDSDETQTRLEENSSGEPAALPGMEKWVLNGVSFKANVGECIALVGPSGSGKSTLATLLPRLYDASEGEILLDGMSVKEYSLKTLRESIGVVQQDSMVFSGSVRDNIAYARPNATEAEVIEAAQAANAHGFIMKLPQGYKTKLGERGVNLSGGQRQRLSIARAILKNPRVLILDEATSALDAESEALVQEALERLMEGRTCLVIAHRLSTIRNADRILVLKDGQIAEQGKHEELVASNGLYAKLVRQQLGLGHEGMRLVGGEAEASEEVAKTDQERRSA